MASIPNPTAPQLSEEDKKKQTWGEYGKQVYNEQYERWMPWIEDFYLRWFTRDNKASYATKGQCPCSIQPSLLPPCLTHFLPNRHPRQVQGHRRQAGRQAPGRRQ